MNNKMINDLDRSTTSSALSQASNCRHNTLSDNKSAKHVQRRRMEVRRLKSLCESESDFAGDNWFCNNKRSKDMISAVPKLDMQSVIALSCTGSPVSSSENDVKMITGRSESTPSSSHGSISVMGRRREMEDAVMIELGFVEVNTKKYDFYGVYDGHGGAQVANACGEWLHGVLKNEVVGTTKGVDWEKVMVESFRKMDDKVMELEVVGSIGSTAVVAVVGEEVLVVANCGDSRAIMSRSGAPVALSIDHKPGRPDELKRIEDLGGRVIDWNGQRVLGVLATSRSIGDNHLKPYVTSHPEVMVCERSSEDEFLILASDGLWDVIQNDLACEVVRRCLTGRMRRRFTLQVSSSSEPRGSSSSSDQQPQMGDSTRAAEAASVLAELAIARGSKDNVSVVVVYLINKSVRRLCT